MAYGENVRVRLSSKPLAPLSALFEAACAAVEPAAFRVSPEIIQESRIVEMVLVQSRKRLPGLVAEGSIVADRSVDRQEPVFLRVQRRVVVHEAGERQARFPGVDGNGIQDSARVVPLRLGNRLRVHLPAEIGHQVGEFLPVVPRPVCREIVVGIRLQVHVAEGEPGRIRDVQHGQHPFRGRPLAVGGGRDREPVESLVIQEIEGRRHIPVPLDGATYQYHWSLPVVSSIP